jgi:hypothetical protein
MVRLPSWGCISMSLISKLSMLGAAGSGGGPGYFFVELPVGTSGGKACLVNNDLYTFYRSNASGSTLSYILQGKNNGTVGFQKTINTSGNVDVRACSANPAAGTVLLVGAAGGGSGYLTEVSSDGAEVNDTKVNSGVPVCATADSTGNIYIGGTANSRAFITKLDEDHNISWTFQFQDGGTQDGLYSVYGVKVRNSNGDVYYYARGYGITSHLWVGKLNSSGVQQWIKRISRVATGYIGETSLIGLNQSTGDVYVGSVIYGSSPSNIPTMVKMSSSGSYEWQRDLIGTSSSNYADFMGLDVDSTGKIYCLFNTGSDDTNFHVMSATDTQMQNNSGHSYLQFSLGTSPSFVPYGFGIEENEEGVVDVGIFAYNSGSGNDSNTFIKAPSDGSITGSFPSNGNQYGNLIISTSAPSGYGWQTESVSTISWNEGSQSFSGSYGSGTNTLSVANTTRYITSYS